MYFKAIGAGDGGPGGSGGGPATTGRVAIFKDAGGDILNGGEGDVLDGRYRLLKINAESADLAYTDGRGRQTIRLSGQ